ncbi:hypothetical protein SNOG_11987 [Parastagonospora nodorum SN15]|uniref:Zn(2)-C6 fungal-type domain-containing protein n=1 Tax=Phaeosphaeria nodorum (strain SN15 / ATCC MYA-4574 / FGSC 10173) TaxID=321614 RepID=Q0U8C7_PHANO|nr:hypothetical protein SNOG_11987 [Parastagonospora nodorum SN15]EAT80399.2 hypothetical protein SNOG_11987 [Parastagonospora nodorum SN15]
MSFARRDLLQRHYTVHGRNQNNEEGVQIQGMIPKSAGRTPIACSNCAKTKTKCDKKFPCTRCAQRNLTCTLRPTRRASKGMQRAASPTAGGPGSEHSSQSGPSAANSPAHDAQPHQATQLPPHVPGGPDRSQSSSVTHSRNQSVSQPVQPISNPNPEERPLQIPLPNTPTFFEQPVPHHSAQVSANGMNGFVASTPMSGYDDFVQTVQDHPENEPNPQFMMDPWTTMAMGNEFDPMRIDPQLMMSMNMDMSIGPPSDAILGMMPEMSPTQPFGPVQTPLQTPQMDESFSDLQIGSSAAMFYPSNRHSSIADAGIPDLGAIVAAQDGWTVFRCTPSIPSSSCPRTAKLNLERLELSLRNHEGWSNWTPSWDESDFQQGGQVAVSKLGEAARDKLLAITQSFLHKALDIHKDGSSSASSGESPGSIASGTNFILLPPGRVLEFFLQSYANSFERYYPTSARGVLDANELMKNYNDKASSLLILMMIAQGAMNIPSVEARWLTGGLTEACRISLFDLIEKNIIMASDPIVLRAALLFTVQAGWSGDKWQMDIAMGQRGILIYSWVMVDQDLSLFHDTNPLFSVTEFGAPMPDADILWQARTAAEWSETFNQVHAFSNGHSSTLVCQYCQLLSCFSDSVASRSRNRALTAASTRVRLEEVQALLGRWFDLARRYMKCNPICPMMQANLVMFHLISMNAVTNFPEIERLARREGFDSNFQQIMWMHNKCLSDVQEAIVHAGQILRLVREMPRGIRPPWWAGAVYRAALVMWTDSLVRNESTSPRQQGHFQPPNATLAIDQLTSDHPMILRYVSRKEGIPTLTKRDGTIVTIDNSFAVLSHCVDVLDEGVATRFSDGIRNKLERLARG